MKVSDLKRIIAKLSDDVSVNFSVPDNTGSKCAWPGYEYTVTCAMYNPVLKVLLLAGDDDDLGPCDRVLYNENEMGSQP